MKFNYKVSAVNEVKTVDSRTQTVSFEAVRLPNELYPNYPSFSFTVAADQLDSFAPGQEVTLTIE